MAQRKTQKAAGDAKPSVKAPTTDAVAPKTEARPKAMAFDKAAQFCLAGTDTSTADARAIWDRMQCDTMPTKFAIAVFDCALDQGQNVAERLVEKVTALTAEDGNEVTDSMADAVVIDFLAWRLRRYAFTGNAATRMKDNAARILRLHAFIMNDLVA